MLLVLLESTLVYSVIKLSPYPHLISVRTYDYILGKREFLADPFRLFWGNLKAIAAWIYSYQGLFPGMFMVIAAVYGLKKKFKFVLLVLAWILSPIVISAFIGRIIFPRYFLVVQPFLILLLLPLVERVLTKWRKFGVAVLLLVFSYWVYFDFMLLNIPAKAPLTKQEQSQYMASWAAGYGIKEAAQYIVKESGGKNKVYVATEGYFGTLPDGLMIYLTDYPNIEVYGIGQPIYNLPEELKERAKETDAYLVVNDSRLKTDLPGVTAKYPKPVFSFQPQESLLLIKL